MQVNLTVVKCMFRMSEALGLIASLLQKENRTSKYPRLIYKGEGAWL